MGVHAQAPDGASDARANEQPIQSQSLEADPDPTSDLQSSDMGMIPPQFILAESDSLAATAEAGSEDHRDGKIRELEARLDALEQAVINQQAIIQQQARLLGEATGPILIDPTGPPGTGSPESPAIIRQAESEIDDILAERALERTLVRSGALLLPPSFAEIEPSISYVRREDAEPIFVALDEGNPFLGENTVLRDDIVASLSGRLGLPFDSQLEAGIGFTFAEETDRLNVLGAPVEENTLDGSGVNDVFVSVAKTLVTSDRGVIPDLIGRISWDTGSGQQNDGDLSLSGGSSRLGASLTAIGRQDPLVFVGSVGYDTGFENDGIKEGDEISLGASALLAVSPDTSLRLGMGFATTDDIQVDGQSLPGSDSQFANLSIGFSSILSRSTFIEASLDIGLTEDSPDYAVTLSAPLRLPRLFSGN